MKALRHLGLCDFLGIESEKMLEPIGPLKLKLYKYLCEYQTEVKLFRHLFVTHFLLSSSWPGSRPPSCWWTIPLPLPQCPWPVTPHKAKAERGAGQVEVFQVTVSLWCFYWPQQMASLSLCIVMVAILLWLSGLTIVASRCGRQKQKKSLLSNQML